jgi:hypothetical protein
MRAQSPLGARLRPQTGLSTTVSSYVLSQPGPRVLDQMLALFTTMRAREGHL